MSKNIEHNGEIRSLLGWSKHLGITYATLYNRYKRGAIGEELFNLKSNRSTIGKVEHQDKEMTLYEWAQEIGIPYNTLWKRYERGIRGDDLFSPYKFIPKKGRMITYDGKTQNLAEWGRELGISREAVRQRVDKGLPLDVALGREKMPGKKLKVKVDERDKTGNCCQERPEHAEGQNCSTDCTCQHESPA